MGQLVAINQDLESSAENVGNGFLFPSIQESGDEGSQKKKVRLNSQVESCETGYI